MSTEPVVVKRKRPLWHWIVGIIGALIVLSMIGNAMGDDDADPITNAPAASDSGDNVADAPKPTDEPTAVPTDAPPAPSFADMIAFRETATDAAWDVRRKEWEGTAAKDWPANVVEIKAKSGDRFEVWVDLNPDGVFGVQDAYVTTSDAGVINWSKDAPVIVSGIIKDVDSLLGSITVRFEDGATVVAAP